MDRERALLPATQPRIEAINEAKRLEKEVLTPMKERRKEILATIRQLELENTGIQTQIWDMTNHAERLRTGVGVDEAAAKSRNAFVRRCPAEGCRGFLSSAWKCGVCELYSCPDCQEVKGVARDTAHTCDPGALETAKLIAKDTKACPKCGEMITKIDGCDQMWCVSCHTAFSWRTGQVASGTVHNPHYYEYLRKRNGGEAPRNVGDIPCGGLIDWGTIRRVLLPVRGTSAYPGWLTTLELAHRKINHVQNADMPHLAQAIANINDNIDLRIQYLLKAISEAQMMTVLQAREKKREKELEIRRVYETLTGAGADIFRRLLTAISEKGVSDAIINPFLLELDELRKFINEALDVLRRRYNCSLHGFDANWDRLTLKKSRVGEADADKPSVYGIFVEELKKFDAEFAKMTPPTLTELPRVWDKPWFSKIRKVSAIIRTFPQSATATVRYAGAVITTREYDIHIAANLHSAQNRIYYTNQKTRIAADAAEWNNHVKGLSLTTKRPENAIEETNVIA
jgi:hypothetical protein